MANLLYRASTTPATPGATSAKGTPLTNLEVDGNFKSLNDAIAATAAGAPSLTGTGATGTWGISITGNAATVTNGVVTTGSYADPSWITSLAGSKVTGVVLEAGSYANPSWITALAGSKVTGALLSSGTYADPSWLTSLSYLKVGIPTVSGQTGKILSNNGTALQWITPATGGVADGNTTYTIAAATATGGANLTLTGSDASTDTIKFASGTNTTVAYTDASTITISSSYVDTNTTYTLGAAQSAANANIQLTAGGSGSGTQNVQLVAGTNISLSVTGNAITINSAGGSSSDTYYTYALSAVSQAGSAGAAIRSTSTQYINGTGQTPTTADLLFTNGAGISMSGTGSTITVAAATATTGIAGIVSTGAQSFAGAKTFTGAVIMNSTLQVDSTAATGALSVTGAITATGNITAYSSDARLKSNVQEITDAVAKIESIGGYTFDWNPAQCEAVGFVPEAEHEHGVIAQEIQAIMPDVVVPAAFNQDYLTVRYERIVPLLIQAVKELSARVKELEAK